MIDCVMNDRYASCAWSLISVFHDNIDIDWDYSSDDFHQIWVYVHWCTQGLVKGAKLCFRNPHFYFGHGESTSTASQLTSPASLKSKDLNKVSLLLQDLGCTLTK